MSEEPKTPKMSEDWDKDAFPTSAKPIFRAVALLLATILALCALVYYISDHPEKELEQIDKELKQIEVEEDLLPETE